MREAVEPLSGEGTDLPETDLRSRITGALAAGELHRAMLHARDLLAAAPNRRNFRFVRDAMEQSGSAVAGLKPTRIALLSSFSIEFLHDSLIALGFANGLQISVYQSPFGTFRREPLDPESGLYRFGPDAVVLAVEGADWVPEAFDGYFERSDAESVVAQFRQDLLQLATALRARSSAPLFVHNIALPAEPKLGIYDAKADDGQGALIARLNQALAAVAREVADVHVVDYATLVARHGARHWYDERMRHYARAPIASAMQPYLAAEYVKAFRALAGLTCKCLVLDLDNTLWGGVIGEDGINGIALGPNYPGSAFVAFQRHILDLYHRGVILACASKNNPSDVEEVFAKHRFMLLRPEHFAATQIDWKPKSESLVRIAETLSIGLEHIVFADDNPAECTEVRRALPMVRVVQLPRQPEAYVRTLQEAGLFDSLSLSSEDRRRGELYRQRAQAEATRNAATNLEDYYRDLAMRIEVAPVTDASLARTAQLTQKTNQFNVTTRRYSEAEVRLRAADPKWFVSTTSVTDRFGDNGIVGVTMARESGDCFEIDTLLMSCRVIGRTVETAMLAHLCDEARARSLPFLRGVVIPTAKNAPARDLFERHGFAQIGQDDNGSTRWQLELAQGGVPWPDWFARTAAAAQSNDRDMQPADND